LLQALAIDPENPYALINLGAVYEKEGQVEKAISSYRQVIRSETLVTATDSSDPAKVGLPLRQIAEENLRRLQAGRLNSSGLIGNGQ